MLLIVIFSCLICLLTGEEEEEGGSPLFHLKKRLAEYYKEPPVTGSQVLSAGIFYLHELTRLQEAVAEKIPNAKELLVKLDEDGGPQHCVSIPYGSFIDKYNWEGEEISNYHTVIANTRKVWDELRVQELGKPEVY